MHQPDHLRADEDVIEEFSVSAKYTILLVIIGVLALLLAGAAMIYAVPLIRAIGGAPLGPLVVILLQVALIIGGLYAIGLGIYLQIGYDFFLSNQRVIESVGFLSRRELSTEYRQINDLIVRQDFINKLILNTGTLAITTPGTAGEEFKLLNIDNPIGRRDLLRRLIRAGLDGHKIDRYTVAHAKVAVGMAASEEEALKSLNSISPNASEELKAVAEHEEQFHTETETPSSVPATPPSGSTSDVPVVEEIEDLHGDGIDASDRLRAAQKQLDDQQSSS